MNWKGLGKKRPWPHFKVLNPHFPGGNEENHEEKLGQIAGIRAKI
jgi:hypothetical protein